MTSLKQLAAQVQQCTNCDLYKYATQAVFGAGPRDARIMLVGEQPGDQEDRRGQPFVGPAGALLDKALLEAGLDRDAVWVTNAVKHFKFKQRGKRRLHDKPSVDQIHACKPWLEAELATLKPSLVVCLGATAARAVLGRAATISALRGRVLEHRYIVTYHPSAILRMRDEGRAATYAALVADLRRARHFVARHHDAVAGI